MQGTFLELVHMENGMLEAGGVCCLTCAVLRPGLFWPWVAGDGRGAEGLVTMGRVWEEDRRAQRDAGRVPR